MYRGYWLVSDLDGTLLPTPSKTGGRYCSFTDCASQWGSHHRSCLPSLQHFLRRGGSLCIVTTAGRRVWRQIYHDLAPSLFPEEDNNELTGSSSVSEARTGSPGRLLICGFTGAAMFQSRDNALVWKEYKRMRGDVGSRFREAAPGRSPQNASPLLPISSASAARVHPSYPPASLAMEECVDYREHAMKPRTCTEGSTGCATCASSTAKPERVSSWTGSEPRESVSNEVTRAVAAATVPPGRRSIAQSAIGHAQNDAEGLDSTATTFSPAMTQVATREARGAIVRLFEHVSYISGHNVERAGQFLQACLSSKYHAVYASMLHAMLQEIIDKDGAEAVQPGADGSVPHLCFAHTNTLSMEALRAYGKYLHDTNDALIDVQTVPLPDGSVEDDRPIAQVVVKGIPMAYCSFIFPLDLGVSSLSPSSPLSSSTTRLTESFATAAEKAIASGVAAISTHTTAAAATATVDTMRREQGEENNFTDRQQPRATTRTSSVLPFSSSPVATPTTPYEHAAEQSKQQQIQSQQHNQHRESVECSTMIWNCCRTCGEKALGSRERLTRAHISLKSQPNSACMHRAGVGKHTCIHWLIEHAEKLDFDLARAVSLGDVPATVDKALAQFPPMPFISFSKLANDGLSAMSSIRGNTFHVGGEEEGAGVFLDELFARADMNSSGRDRGSKRARREDLSSSDRACDTQGSSAPASSTASRTGKDVLETGSSREDKARSCSGHAEAESECKEGMLFSISHVKACAQRAERRVASMLQQQRENE